MKPQQLVRIACLTLLAGGLNLHAASGSWTGATDNTWAGANWTAAPVPGPGDTATFDGGGNGFTTIDLGTGVTVGNLIFSTSLAAAYTVGVGPVDSQTLSLNNNGGITLNSTVLSNEWIDAAIVLGTDSTAQTNSFINNSAETLTLAGNVYGGPAAGAGTAGTKTLAIGGAGNTVISGSLLNGASSVPTTTTVALTKLGAGILTFNGTVDASQIGSGAGGGAYGTVTVSGGSLTVDFSNAGAVSDLLNSYSPVSLGGGALEVIGNATNASIQNFTNGSGVTVNPGLNVISAGPNGGNPTNPLPTLNLGSFPQTLGSQTTFVGPATVGSGDENVAASGTITTTYIGTGNNNQTYGTGTRGLLWNGTTRAAIATVGLYDWASTSLAGGGNGTSPWTIIGGSQVSGFYTVVTANFSSADGNFDLQASAAPASGSGTQYADTLRFNTPGAFTFTPRGSRYYCGGLLVTPNVGANNTTIASGTGFSYNQGNGNGAVDVYQNNTLGELLFQDALVNSQSHTTSYAQAGPGTVVKSGTDANTGASYLNGGVTEIAADANLGAAGTGAAVNLNGGTLLSSASITLDNSGSKQRGITLLGNGGGLAAVAGQTFTIDGQIGSGTGGGPLVIGIPGSVANGEVAGLVPGTGGGTANTTPVYATGTVALTFPSGTAGNFQYGGTLITGGATLDINSQYALGGGDQGPTIFNGGELQYATTLATGAAGTALDISGQPVTLDGNGTIDVNGHVVTYGSSIGDGGSGQLTVANSGTGGGLYLNGGSTHTGGTVVSGILGGSGTIEGNVTVNSGGQTQPSAGAGATNTIGGNLTYNSGAQANFNLGSTAAGGGNDEVVLSGASSTLNSGGVSVGILCGTTLDLANDYVLFNLTGGSAGIAGNFAATPLWLAATPSGAANYQIIKSGNQIRLHYSGTTPPTISAATATPATVVRNQPTLISVTAAANVGTISSVTVNLNAIGGASAVSLYLSDSPEVYTNTITVPAASTVVTTNLAVTAADTAGNTASADITLTVLNTTETWSGLGGGNWSDNADWASTFAPGLAGDNLVFAGTTGLNSTMDNSYSITGLTFTNGAGSFNIGAAGGILTVTANGVVNNSASPQTLNVPVVLSNPGQSLSAAAGSLTLGQGVDNGGNLLAVADGGFNTTIAGPVTGGGALTKTGAGTLTLAGTNTYSGSTLVSGGAVVLSGLISNGVASSATVTINSTLTVNAGGGIITGSGAATSGVIVGGAAGNAFLNLAGGAVDINENFNPAGALGTVTGADGFLAMTSGSLDCSAGEFHIGQAAGAYGAFDFKGGTITVGDVNPTDAYFVVGAGGEGVLNMSGGLINDSAEELSIAGIAGGIGVANVSGGALNDNLGIHVGDRGTATLNVSGSASVNLAGGPLQFGLSGNTTTGTVNLLGGTVTANYVGTAGTSTSRLNFNGGTLAASAASGAFLQGLTAATLYSGGAIIDDGGNLITIAQALLAPSGNGVSAIPVVNGGAGYQDTPVVSISGGGGVGASAVANVSGGAVAGIIILSPGTGYTTAPTVTLFGGGYATAATLGAPTLAADISGGLTKQGAGTLTLTGTDTYTNLTAVAAGTLSLGVAPTATAGYVVADGATLDVSPLGSLTLSAGQSLSGSGTNNGSFATSPGVSIYPGTIGTVGTLTFNNDLDLSGGGTCYFDITNSASGANDQIVVGVNGGALTVNGGLFHVHALAGASPLDITADYVLVTNLTTPNIASLPTLVWDGTKPANAANYSLKASGNNLALHYAPLSGPLVSDVTLSPATAFRGQSVTVTATVTPGSGAIDPNSGVTVNLGAFGGSATASLVLSNANVYTNTLVVPAGASPGGQLVTVTATDANSLTASGGATLTIIPTTDVWSGLGTGNWSDKADWASMFAPGLAGDTLVFAGTTGLTPSMDTNYSVTSLTFASGAGSFAIGTTAYSLAITAGGVTNDSVNAENLNVPVTLDSVPQTLNAAAGDLILGQNLDNGGNLLTVTDGGHNTTLNGSVSDTGGLTMTGSGTLTLGGANTYAGATTINSGTVLVNGTGAISTSTSQVIVGNASNNAVLNIDGGSVQANDAINPAVAIGNVPGASGFLFMSSGSLECGAGEFHIGQASGAYGAFDFSGGTFTIGDFNPVDAYFVVGGAYGNSASEGVFNMSGGTLNDSARAVSIANIAGAIGVANVSGGTLNDNFGIHVGERGTGTLNVSGSASVNLSGGPLQFGFSGTTTVGTVNLLGGTVTADYVGAVGTSTSLLNFNGGTLMAGAATATFLQGLTAATIYRGGAVIDDGGNAITIAQALLAPTGNGVTGIPVATGGAGYLDTPIVTITGGGGVGATAVANVADGAVTNITIVSPGTGYTSAPTVSLFGGGCSSPATLGTAILTANTGGGLTKQNSGTLTLSGANTYAGNTTVNGGTLEIVQPVIATNSTVTVASGAALQLDFAGTNVITNLVLNGVAQTPGFYNSATASPYITGAGALQVVVPVTIATNPTNILFSVTGSTLSLSWPADHTGWRLLVQTNHLQNGLSANPNDWMTVPGSTGVDSTNFLINPALPAEFYQLIYP